MSSYPLCFFRLLSCTIEMWCFISCRFISQYILGNFCWNCGSKRMCVKLPHQSSHSTTPRHTNTHNKSPPEWSTEPTTPQRLVLLSAGTVTMVHNGWCAIVCKGCGRRIRNPTHGCKGRKVCTYEEEKHDETHDVVKCVRCKRPICLQCPDMNYVYCPCSDGHHCQYCYTKKDLAQLRK